MAAGRRGRRAGAVLAGAVVAAAVGAAVLVADRGRPVPVPAPVPVPSAGAPPRYVGASDLIARPRAAGAWPGANGLSGVNGDPVNDRAHAEAFCTARGRACGVAHAYTDRRSYPAMTSGSDWVFAFYDGFPGALVVSQSLVPEGRPQDLAGCARGDVDHLWRDFGAVMVRHGRGDAVVRLGWEFNGDFMAWNGADPATWIACYRRAADGIRATNPAVLLDWTINGHGTPATICGGLSTNCYPGDAYVDIVGIDNYDHYPASASKAQFDATAAAPDGLDWLYAFAKRRGKLFSVGEWGVVPTADAGRESPEFVRWMHAWFAAHAPDLAYEAYFSDCSPNGVQSSLFRTDAACRPNPGSAAAYRELFGG